MKTPFVGSGLLSLLPTLILLSSTSPLSFVQAQKLTCKTTPNESTWPSLSQWASLNQSLSGRLLHPLPPASACHPSFPDFSLETCAMINQTWGNFTFHQDDPVSVAWNNMNNDSCLPNTSAPCSELGYPVYVVNASSADDVKLAVNFARENNVRLNVKASGHDYLRRSTAPYSLSIWTRYMVGYEYHDTFQPQGCNATINTPAVTGEAGSYVKDIYYHLNLRNQTCVDGLGAEVTMGGYLTGGGHSPISNIYGLGADQVYEVEMVTPIGEIVIANECQNTDLFWAVRGGGGATFGVLTKITIRTIPVTPIEVYDFTLETAPNSTTYWEILSYFLAQYPALNAANVSSYTNLDANTTSRDGEAVASFQSIFLLNDPSSANSLADMWAPFWAHVNETYPNQTTTIVKPSLFSSLYALYGKYADTSVAGVDKVVGSWLLPPETLTNNEDFGDALKTFMGDAGARLYMLSGKGVWDAVPRGGSDAINPAWRKALVHAVTSQDWTPLNEIEQREAEYSVNRIQTEAFRQLLPESGAYVNEAYINEPDFQRAFWGTNYNRLAQIKKAVDPDDVFWCHVCVGSEGWEEVGDYLCRV